VQQQRTQAVIVFSSDQLTRNPVDGDILRRELRQYGIELHYTTRGAIDDTAEAELFSGIKDQFNAYWRNKLIEATKRGRREKIEGLKGQAIADRINAQGLITPAKAKNISGITDEKFCEEIRQELDEGGEIEFAMKRRFIEALRITATLGVTEDVKWLDIHWNLHTIRVPLDTSTSQSLVWA
jgi:DNA invertase Pin-like site-specific DNA recombinase